MYSQSTGEVNSNKITSSLLQKRTRLPTHAHEVGALTFEVTDNFGSNDVLPCGAYGPRRLGWWPVCKSVSSRRKLESNLVWGRNSSVGSALARCPLRLGFDPPLGTFPGRGDFSLGVNMGSNSIPPKTLSDESINRGLVCAHIHFISRTQKILTFMS